MSKDLLTAEQLENGTSSDKLIVLKSVFKNGKYTVQPAKDLVKNWFHGVPRLSEDEKKKLDYFTTPDSKLILIDGMEFDLNDPVAVENWKWVKHLPCVAMSFEEAQKTPSAQFYVYIAGREAREANKNSDLKFKAIRYIMEDSPVNYENRALILDNDLAGESPEEIKKILIEIAERQPTRVIAAYEAKNLSIKLLYLKARQKGIVKSQDGMILFGSNVLGVNQEGALAFLQTKEHSQILDLLEKEVEISNSLELSSKTEDFKETKSNNKDNKNFNWNFNKK
jgi:hypothetical protein